VDSGESLPHGVTSQRRWWGWHSVYVWFALWNLKGIWARLAEGESGDINLEILFIESNPSHQPAAASPKGAREEYDFVAFVISITSRSIEATLPEKPNYW